MEVGTKLTLGCFTLGGKNGYINVSKFGLHHFPMHSPTYINFAYREREREREREIPFLRHKQTEHKNTK